MKPQLCTVARKKVKCGRISWKSCLSPVISACAGLRLKKCEVDTTWTVAGEWKFDAIKDWFCFAIFWLLVQDGQETKPRENRQPGEVKPNQARSKLCKHQTGISKKKHGAEPRLKSQKYFWQKIKAKKQRRKKRSEVLSEEKRRRRRREEKEECRNFLGPAIPQ
jgi:hypothetical protein